MLEMIEARIVALWRRYIRLLRTDKERVGVAERCVRGLLVVVPYYALALLLLIRAALWRPLTIDYSTEDGIHFRCRLPDGIQTFVYLFGTWEPDLTAFLLRRLRPGDTFIDVGGNVGYMSALASRLVGPHGAVVAIKPAPAAGAALQETVTMNDLSNTRLVAAAVSDREGELPLFAGPSFLVTGDSTTVARAALGSPPPQGTGAGAGGTGRFTRNPRGAGDHAPDQDRCGGRRGPRARRHAGVRRCAPCRCGNSC